MNPHTIPFIIMIISAVLAGVLAFIARRWRNTPGVNYFSALMLAVAILATADAVELIATALPDKITWSKLSYLGLVNIAPLWLMFCLHFSHRTSQLTRGRVAALWVIPLTALVLAVTNEWHGLIWSTVKLITPLAGSLAIYELGAFYWIHIVYAYLLLLLGTYWLMRSARHAPPLYQRQVAFLVIGALIPWAGNLLFIVRLNPWPGIDLTSIGLMLTGVFILAGISRYHTFDIAPVAREVLFNNLADGVLVLDQLNRLVDINPVAYQWTGLTQEAIGKNIFDVLDLNEAIRQYENITEIHTHLEFSEGVDQRVYDLMITPLRDANGQIQGRVALLHDIRHEHALAKTEHRRARQMELLNTITRTALSTPELHDMIQVLADSLGELFNADGAYLTLWDEEQQRTSLAAAYGAMREIYPAYRSEPGEKTLTASVLNAGHRLVVENISRSAYLNPRNPIYASTTSILALPMIVDHQKLGAILVAFNQTHQFTPEEITLGEQAAGQIAISIAKVRLDEAERRRAAQLAALQSVSQAVVSSLDLDKIFDTVANLLSGTFKYQFVSIYRLYGDTLRLAVQAGYPREEVFHEINVNQGVMGRSVRTRQPIFVRDTSREPDFLRAAKDIQSEICVPLLHEDTVLGTLNVESLSQDLTDEDMQLLITFASQVVVAINNASLYAEIQRLANVDELTGLYNRRGLFELGRREFERATRFKHSLAALFLDIDYFKVFNDTYSYAVGDQVLQLFADCLHVNLRDFDLVVRYGGEEFVVLLPEADLPSAREVAERIRHSVEHLRVETGQGKTNITVSIGVCLKTPEIANLEALVEGAGQAVHEAKNLGRNRVAVLKE